MLLRRITNHVRDQNWFAVGLDFVIVVVGVFIGIQVANWNEARLEDRRAAGALDTLLFETEQNLAYARLIILRNEQLQRDREAAMAALRGTTPPGGDAERGLTLLPIIRDFTPRYANYDELRAVGDVTLLQSVDIRDMQSNILGVTMFNDRRREDMMASMPDILSLAEDYIRLREGGDEAQPVATVDWERARRDDRLVNAAARAMSAQIYWAGRLSMYQDQIEELCTLIAAEADAQCTPPDWIVEQTAREAEESEG